MQSTSMLRRIGRVVRALDSHPGDREFESTSGIHPRVGASLAWTQVWHEVTPSGRDPWLGWGTYIPCNPSVWEAELSH